MWRKNFGERRELSVALRGEWTLEHAQYGNSNSHSVRFGRTFFQDNPALVASILKGIQSTKVFATNIITIAGDYSLTTFVTSRVNRVDLITEVLPPWKHPDDILDMVELAEDPWTKATTRRHQVAGRKSD